MMKMILSLAVLLTLAVAPTGRASATAASPSSQIPVLSGCWTMTAGNDLKLPVKPTVWTFTIEFTAQGAKSVGRFLTGPGIQPAARWEAEVLKGTSVFYVPMSLRGDSPAAYPAPGRANLQVFAGIADSATHITGTWVDMRGIIDGSAAGNEIQVDQVDGGHKIIFPIQSGWFRLAKGCSP